MLAADFECWVEGNALMHGHYRGVDGYLRMQKEWAAEWKQISYEIDRTYNRGDTVVVTVRYQGTGAVSEIEIEGEAAYLITVDDDEKLRSLGIYTNPGQALQVAGIE